jgi:NADPH-dependent 2,4-dienoyl-CoA reductase/sulfur reductase-like enzyme
MSAAMQNQQPLSCDVLIIGAGPAGMAAALAAAPSGARITMVDDNPAPGGQIWRDGAQAKLPPAARKYRADLAKHANITLLSGTRVAAVLGPKQLLLENAEQGTVLTYQTVIVCTGARELLLPFPGWTLPGVTGAGGLQALIKGGLPVAGQRIVVAGSGPLLLAAAATARVAGATVVRIAEQAPWAQVMAFGAGLVRWPGKIAQAATLASPHYRANSFVREVQGEHSVESVSVQVGTQNEHIACDRVACGFGLVPNTQLAQALGLALDAQHGIAVDAYQASSVPDHFAAGECTGFGGSERALVQGAIAGFAAVREADRAQALWPQAARWDRFASHLATHFALRPELSTLAEDDTIVCRCEDVRMGQLHGMGHWVDAKLQTRCGMGACQGRVCGAALQHLKGWQQPMPRMPIAPTRIQTLAEIGPIPSP